RLLFT
ncbi:hypothetical protein VCHENC02_5937B, partial [Vibrio harveyi]